MFFGPPIFGPKTSPGQPGPNFQIPGPHVGSGVQKWTPGAQTKKMRTEKPCRTPVSDLEMEAYGASYGQKTFWGHSPGPAQAQLGGMVQKVDFGL